MSFAQLSGGGGGLDPTGRAFVPVTWHYSNAPPSSISISDLILVNITISACLYDLQPSGTFACAPRWSASYGFVLRADISSGGSYGPTLRYDLDDAFTTYSAGGPAPHLAPTESTLAALMPDAASVEFSDSSGAWVVCFNGRDPTAIVTQWVQSPASPFSGLSRWSMDPQAPRMVADWGGSEYPTQAAQREPGTTYITATATIQLSGSSSLNVQGPGSPQCIDMQGGTEPGEPWTPPIDYPTFEEFEAPELPEDPPAFVPPQLGAPTVEGEMPEGFETAAVEDHLQSALDRWRARLGLPNHNTILSTGAANVDFDVLQFDFQVGDIHVPISIDFGAWRPQLSLFGYFVNVAAVVWVLCGVYDAVRRA